MIPVDGWLASSHQEAINLVASAQTRIAQALWHPGNSLVQVPGTQRSLATLRLLHFKQFIGCSNEALHMNLKSLIYPPNANG